MWNMGFDITTKAANSNCTQYGDFFLDHNKFNVKA